MGRGAAADTIELGRSRPATGRRGHPAPEHGFSYQHSNGLTLITPAHIGKMNRSDWRDDELPYRSVVIRESTGEVLSAGFPKFFNYHESEQATEQHSPEATRLNLALELDEPVWMTEKLDGSLAIRSVIDREVIFRTRGSLDFNSEHCKAIRACAGLRYPQLLDPEFEAGRSLLFEFVSPSFRIVLPYPEDDLVLVGAVRHTDFQMADMPELRQLAHNHELRLVEIVELPRHPDELLRTVHDLEGKEGIVARCDHGQTLVKLKGAEYLTRHRLRFSLSARAVRELCVAHDIQHADQFEQLLKASGGDWELCSDARPLVDAYLRADANARRSLDELADQVQAKQVEHPDRGEFARLFALPLGGARTHAAFALLSGKHDQALKILRDDQLEQEFTALEAADQQLQSTEL